MQTICQSKIDVESLPVWEEWIEILMDGMIRAGQLVSSRMGRVD